MTYAKFKEVAQKLHEVADEMEVYYEGNLASGVEWRGVAVKEQKVPYADQFDFIHAIEKVVDELKLVV